VTCVVICVVDCAVAQFEADTNKEAGAETEETGTDTGTRRDEAKQTRQDKIIGIRAGSVFFNRRVVLQDYFDFRRSQHAHQGVQVNGLRAVWWNLQTVLAGAYKSLDALDLRRNNNDGCTAPHMAFIARV